MTDSLTWEQALAWRVRRHQLHERAPASALVELAARLCGLHAQVMSSAELTLWSRLDGLERRTLERALWDDRTLVKTWAMRGTLHLLPAAEYRLWQTALSTYDHYRRPSWLKAFGLTAEQLDQLSALIATALDGQVLTRGELADAVATSAGSAALGEQLRESWGAYLKPAAFMGQLCFGPSRGQQVGFTGPATWLGPAERLEPGAALAAVVRRYLGAYGPARREDLARWWGVPPARAGRLLAELGDDAVELAVGGTRAWMLRAQAIEAAQLAPTSSVRLLAAFDQYVVGSSRDVPELIVGPNKARIHRPQGWISPVLLIGGRLAGVWRHERRGKRLELTIEPFGKPSPAERAGAEHEAERLARFLGGELALRWS